MAQRSGAGPTTIVIIDLLIASSVSRHQRLDRRGG